MMKNDPRYVKYLFRLFGKRNGVTYERLLTYHNCTDADYEEFYPVIKQSEKTLRDIRSDPERGMFCLDWDDEDPIEVIGSEIDNNYTRLEVVLVPCNYVHQQLGDVGDFIHPECVPDLES